MARPIRPGDAASPWIEGTLRLTIHGDFDQLADLYRERGDFSSLGFELRTVGAGAELHITADAGRRRSAGLLLEDMTRFVERADEALAANL